MKKPSAAERTVDMFAARPSLQTPHEPVEAVTDDAAESKEGSPLIEDNLDKWRDKAFETQEWASENFGKIDEGIQFRWSRRGGHVYLEATRANGGAIHSYNGVMFTSDEFRQLVQVTAKAWKGMQD